MKKLGLLVAVGALSGLMVVGSTLAFFTDRADATNTFSTGKVAVDLWEQSGEQKAVKENNTGLAFTNLVPGDNKQKIVTVQNTGSVSTFVRITIGNTTKLTIGGINTTDWYTTDNVTYYYKKALQAGSTTEALFTDVTVPKDWDNTKAYTVNPITLTLEAIQADNIDGVTYDKTTFAITDMSKLTSGAVWTNILAATAATPIPTIQP